MDYSCCLFARSILLKITSARQVRVVQAGSRSSRGRKSVTLVARQQILLTINLTINARHTVNKQGYSVMRPCLGLTAIRYSSGDGIKFETSPSPYLEWYAHT
ncbi:hypothetical protein SCLCIDRAFT_1208072 [Scleroderma citrinum Foug A]|uniref:Uncharacterized protein n=1 Tax=Scleroderma citrinum Foug A TaxID=1036808 RepID=A0A0C3AXB6_9AGAM|nr:hypothetical protein SCLCIDRAFT_1208072 [Scleroderma citrinum Foug A]